ncbi:MAG: hypothetical protein WBQ21_13130 [Solirubrobacteraceae bacterium]
MFVSPGPLPAGHSEDDAIEQELSSIPTLSTGILSATQGTYKTDQLLLDITQGARVSYSAYSPAYPPKLSMLVVNPPQLATSRQAPGAARPTANQLSGTATPYATLSPWAAVRKRAEEAPQLLVPGLLASSIPGGAAYAGSGSFNAGETAAAEAVNNPLDEDIDGALAADRSGKIAAVSLGPPATLLARIATLQSTHRLVVADLPAGAPGYVNLRALAADRSAGELLVVIQRAPQASAHELLWSAFAGLGPGGHTITSQTTNERGMIAAIDIGPTILDHLRLAVPADMRGKPVRLDGPLHSSSLRGLKARLEVLDSRRLPALGWLVAAWALLLVVARLPMTAQQRGTRDGQRTRDGRDGDAQYEQGDQDGPASRHTQRSRSAHGAWAMRVGALAMLWTPVAVLLPAALEPSRSAEFALIVAVCFALGALTDRLTPWPRAPIVPAVAAVVALTVDALAGTQLLMRSLLGPNPAFGARFYGIGNELKSGLAVLVFSAVAAALYPAVRGRRAAAIMACAGILLAIVEGSARIGAGVGGVILVSAGTAVATVMLLPGTFNRKRALVVMAAPVVGLVALAAIDLTTAHGSGHFTGSVLDARSPGDIRDIIVRRYGAAWDELKNHLMPLATALALLASVVAVRRRERVLSPVGSDPGWLAALAGGLTAGVIGALSEDSGPELLVVAAFTLGCVLSYLWGGPSVWLLANAGIAPSLTPNPLTGGTPCTRSSSTPRSSTAPPTRGAPSPTTSPSTACPNRA